MITREDLESGRDAKYWKENADYWGQRAMKAEVEIQRLLGLLEEARIALAVTGVKQKDTAVFPPDAWGQQRTAYDTTTDVD